jgi:hypothetical protein
MEWEARCQGSGSWGGALVGLQATCFPFASRPAPLRQPPECLVAAARGGGGGGTAGGDAPPGRGGGCGGGGAGASGNCRRRWPGGHRRPDHGTLG